MYIHFPDDPSYYLSTSLIRVEPEAFDEGWKYCALDTGHELSVRKTSRPGTHLNILCTSNLRPVFGG